MISNPAATDSNSPKGFLIDLDLAKELHPLPTDQSYKPTSTGTHRPHRTGTLMFMAIEVLDHTCRHTYRHDLESFLYVLIYLCIGFAGDSVPASRAHLTDVWEARNASYIKLCMMSDDRQYEKLMQWFPPSMMRLGTTLVAGWRDVLFPLKKTGRGVEIGTVALGDPEDVYAKIAGLLRKAIEREEEELDGAKKARQTGDKG